MGAKWFDFGTDTYHYLLKLPSVFADVASAYLLYVILAEKPERTRLLAAATYLFLPTALFVGPLWGQVDSLLALGLLAIVYLMDRKRPVAAACVYTVAFLTKPQAIAVFPILVFWGIRDHKPQVWAKAAVAALVVGLAMVWPFFPDRPWGVGDQAYDAAQVFGFNASFTYNFFGAFGWFRSADATFFYIHWWQWGILLTALAELAILYSLRNARGPGMMALGLALTMLAFFEFQTRMHERYMFFMFLPLLAACFYLNRPLLWWSFAGLTLMQFFALYAAFFYPTFNAGEPSWLYVEWLPRMLNWSPHFWDRPGSFTQFLCCIFTLLITVGLIIYTFLLHHRVRIEPVSGEEERLGRVTALD